MLKYYQACQVEGQNYQKMSYKLSKLFTFLAKNLHKNTTMPFFQFNTKMLRKYQKHTKFV